MSTATKHLSSARAALDGCAGRAKLDETVAHPLLMLRTASNVPLFPPVARDGCACPGGHAGRLDEDQRLALRSYWPVCPVRSGRAPAWFEGREN
jgi:hypothetical protein